MPSTQAKIRLSSTITQLADVATGPDRVLATDLARRLDEDRLRVLVVGEAKRGKSTVVNALVGAPVLPMGVTPLTAITTTLRYADRVHARVDYRDGRSASIDVRDLDQVVTETANPGNARGIAQVTVYLDAPLLARGVELVDTPGTGSTYQHNTAEAFGALSRMDAAIFVLTADPPISATERELYVTVTGESVRTFVLMNKVDRLEPDEVEQALDFTVANLPRPGPGARSGAAPAQRVHAVTARAALTGTDQGFASFTAEFTEYLEQYARVDLHRSIRRRADRLAAGMLDAVTVSLRAAELRVGEDAEVIADFQRRLSAVEQRATRVGRTVRAEIGALLDRLNSEAHRAEATSTAASQSYACELLASPACTTAEIATSVRDVVMQRMTAYADSWRSGQSDVLERELTELGRRLSCELDRELAGVREDAQALLGVTLRLSVDVSTLAPDPRFGYSVGEAIGQSELIAAAVRRHLPGELGRRRAVAHLHREVNRLAPMQVGRARADLQARLTETARRFTNEVARQYDDTVGRLTDALAEVAREGERGAAQVDVRRTQLQDRAVVLDDLRERLREEPTA